MSTHRRPPFALAWRAAPLTASARTLLAGRTDMHRCTRTAPVREQQLPTIAGRLVININRPVLVGRLGIGKWRDAFRQRQPLTPYEPEQGDEALAGLTDRKSGWPLR